MAKITLVLLTLILSSCTSENLYNSFQPDKSSCSNMSTAQRESCIKQIEKQMTYDEYRNERKKL